MSRYLKSDILKYVLFITAYLTKCMKNTCCDPLHLLWNNYFVGKKVVLSLITPTI